MSQEPTGATPIRPGRDLLLWPGSRLLLLLVLPALSLGFLRPGSQPSEPAAGAGNGSAATPAASAAPRASPEKLPAAVTRIQNTCFEAYPPALVEAMSGQKGPVPEEVRADPRRQIAYLKSEEAVSRGLFYPSLLEDLLPALQATVRPGARFLDLGSGDGRVVFLAALLGARAAGIEYDRDLDAVARGARRRLADLFDADRAELTRGDFFRADFGAYDILFYFAGGARAEARLLAKLRSELRPDAILILAYPYGPIEGFERVGTYGAAQTFRRPPRS